MLFGVQLTSFISAVGVLGLMGIIFAESGLLLGFFLPGDTLLFTAGLMATRGVFGMHLPLLISLLFLAAVLGDNVGYTFGHRVGPRIFKRHDSLLFHQDNLRRAEDFYKRFGPITVLLARFVPIMRTFAPIVAGVGRMNYRTFITFNLCGGLLWTAGIIYLGYFAGSFFEMHGINIDNLLVPIVVLVMLITFASPLYHILREPKSRQLLFAKLGMRR